MNRSLVACLSRTRLPALTALQRSIDDLGFTRLAVDAGHAPFGTNGYLPCTLDGEDASFDIRCGSNQTLPGDDRDVLIALRWSGDPREHAAALIVCSALAQRFGAVVHDPGDRQVLAAPELAARARQALAAL